MRRTRQTPARIVALMAVALLSNLLCAQETAPASQPASAPASSDIRFNFKGATYQQVIDFFSRATGLPVIWESAAPEGTLDYVSPRPYALPEALRVLNIILQSKGVMLRVDNNMLYLQKLEEMAKENIPTYTSTLPADVTDDQIVTLVMPLKIALAKGLAEKLAGMVAAYGSITAMEQQNALVITETAAQVRRLSEIVNQLDQADPEGAVEIFAIKHANAKDLMTPLKALLSQRVEKYVINQQGQQVKIEEDQMPGLTISSDDRTNSIIAKGVQAKIDNLRQAIELLDVPAAEAGSAPAGARGRSVWTATLTIIAANDAAERIRQLFDKIDPKEQPSVVAIDDLAKVIVVGSDEQVSEARSLVNELEGGSAASTAPDNQPQTAVIDVQRADAKAVVGAVTSLLTKRQQAVVKIAPGPDNKSIVVSGLAGDIASVRALVEAVDRQAAPDKQVRQARIAQGDVVKIVDEARKLFDEQMTGLDENARTLTVEVDPEARLVTAVGSARAVEQFTNTLRMIEGNVVVDREARRLVLSNVKPSEMVVPLTSLAQSLLQPASGAAYVAPIFTPADSINTLVITATPQQLAMLEPLVAELDGARQDDRSVRLLTLVNADATQLSQNLDAVFAETPVGQIKPLVRVDASSNSLIVRASDEQFATIEALVKQIDRATIVSSRQMKVVPVDPARGSAATIAEALKGVLQRAGDGGASVEVMTLEELLKTRDSGDSDATRQAPAGAGSQSMALPVAVALTFFAVAQDAPPASEPKQDADVTIAVDDASNSLILLGSPRSIERLSALIKQMQEQLPVAPGKIRSISLPPQMDAPHIASMITQALQKYTPPAGQVGDVAKRAAVLVDGPANALLVAANDSDFRIISDLLAALARPPSKSFPVRSITLQRAPAAAVATAVQQFYDKRAAIEALMRDAGTGAAAQAKPSVAVMGIDSSNTLLVCASDEDFAEVQQLVQQFDTAEASDALTFKVFQLKHARATEIERTVQSLVNDLLWNQADSFVFYWPPRQQSGGGKKDMIAVRADARSNTLIVTGKGDKFDVVEQMIEVLDSPPPQGGERLVKLYHPQHAAITLVADVISAAFNASRQRRPWETPDPTAISVRADENASIILISASAKEHEQIGAMVRDIDAQMAEAGDGASGRGGVGAFQTKVLSVKFVRAREIADTLTRFFVERAKTSNATKPRITLAASDANNSLIVAANENDIVQVEELVAQLDRQDVAAGQGIFIIDLQNITPETAKTIIETIGMDKPQPGRGAGGSGISKIVTEPIKVSLVPGRNTIVVIANPADRDTVVNFLKAIDTAPAMAEAQVIVVPLKNAQASAVATLLQNVLKPAEQQAETPLAKAIQEQVRRLSVHKPGPQDQRVALDLTKPVKITPEPQTNSLILSSTYENVLALEEIIGMFDRLPITEAVTVQIYPLQNIEAEQFARIVKDLFTQGKTLGKIGGPGAKVQGEPEGAAGKALLDEVALSTDDRTNSVIVAGSEDAVALVEVLRTRLDNDMSSAWVEPKVLPLRYADASQLAQTLDAILVQGATNLPQAGPLQKQIARLRMARVKPNGSNVIESDVFTPMSRLIIRPEPQLNALILVGTPANLEAVSELVAMLDIEASSPADSVRIYPLDNASASRLATTIKGLFDQQVQSRSIRPEDRVIVQPDERTNALVVATSTRSFAVLENLLKTLDTKLAPELSELKQIQLKNAGATRMAGLIQQLMDSRLERLRKVQPETADLERATVVADARTNSLVVAAGPESFEVIRQLTSDLDTSTLGDAALIRVLPVVGGNLDRLAQTINQIMQRRYADLPADMRNSQRPLVMTDARTSSLLVAANPEDFASIEDLVNKLSAAPTNPAVGLHIIPLGTGTRAELLAPRLQRLMQDRAASLGPSATPSDRVTIEPDMASNSLIVAASDENLQVVRGLVDMLVAAEREAAGPEAQQQGPRSIEFVPLVSSRAVDIVDLLEDLYITEANRTRGQNVVRATADERLNAVLINAPASDARALKNLIAQLDGARPASVVEIKYVPLQSANAVETVSLIENVLSGRGIGARRNPRQATVLKYLRQIVQGETDPTRIDTQPDEPGEPSEVEMQVSAAIRESITLTPDLRTNTIIVAAPRESIGMIEQMIRDLDGSTGGSKSIRIFKLTNSDAIAMAEILTDLFKLRQGSSMYVLKPREDGFDMAAAAPPPAREAPVAPEPAGPAPIATLSGTELTAVPDERQQLSITVDSRTNSLIVSGTPTYLDLVATVVEELDSLQANERETFVYQLRNAVAADVAKVLSEFVDTEQKKLIGTLSPDQLGSAARVLEREITIKGDEASNTVLVSASPRYLDRVKNMIEQLDVDPPQVLIQVMLAEVTLDSNDQWGVNFRAMVDIGSTTVSGGYGLATAFVNGIGVPNLAIASDDFNLLIRAMKSQGRLQVLSNPSIMAANNAPARIQVGETVRLPAFTAISDTGQQSTTLEKEELGVILEVTPSINPDGFVRMNINPEISNLSQRTTQVSEDFESPIITRRNAETTVTVHDGQTIVIGGLISDRFERRDNKVPFFGDLPFVGALFRASTEETAKTELLIVLTPHVIDSPTHFERVNEVTTGEIDRLSVPESVKEQIRRGMLEGTGGLFDAHGNPINIKQEEEREAGERKEKP